MKIGFDVRVLKSKCRTGVEVYTVNLLLHLLELEQDHRYFLFYSKFLSLKDKLEIFRSKKVPFIEKHFVFSNKLLSVMWRLNNFLPVEVLTDQSYDLFISPHINVMQTKRAKRVVVVHDLAFKKFPHFFTKWDLFWHNYMASASIPRADLIVTVSQNSKNDISEIYGINEDRIKVIYPGVNFLPSQYFSLEKDDYQLPERYILFVGTLEPRKNLVNLLRAFSLIKKKKKKYSTLKMVVLGKKGWLYDNIFSTVDALQLKEEVHFMGFVSESLKELIYSQADLFVYPSFYEGFGFPPLEAMMKGVPCIVSSSSSLPEVTGGAAYLVDPYDIEGMAEGIIEVLENENMRKNLISKGKRRVQEFSWGKTAQSFLKIINDLA